MRYIHINQTMFDNKEATRWPKYRLVLWPWTTAHVDAFPQASTLVLNFCPPVGHCPQTSTLSSGTSSLWIQDLVCPALLYKVKPFFFFFSKLVVALFSIAQNTMTHICILKLFSFALASKYLYFIKKCELFSWIGVAGMLLIHLQQTPQENCCFNS